MELDELDRTAASAFPGSLVRKDLALKFKGQYPVPTYVGEFLLGRYCASIDPAEIAEGLQIVERQLRERTVRAGEHELFKSRARERGSVKLIDLVTARLDAPSDSYLVTLPSLQLHDVGIADQIVRDNERMLTGGFYAEIELQYYPAQESNGRPFAITSLRPIQMSKRDILDSVAKGRDSLTVQQWRDLLLRSVGFEPAMFSPRAQDLLLLRMVPFVERNYNMVELGPRGTGKSHLFQQISPYSHLVSGGKASVARMFVDMRTGQKGLVAQYDVVCFDEVSGIDFDSKDGVNIMKGYMESGEYSRGKESIRAFGGLVMVGNFDVDVAQQLRVGQLFGPFPKEMRDDTAFMDRVHAYVPGWDIPKLHPSLFTAHFGLVSDYLAEMWSHLRSETRLPVVHGRVTYGEALSGRDRSAVDRTVSGLLKLLYPDSAVAIPDDDVAWAVTLAMEVRRRVKEQQKRIGREEFQGTGFSFVLAGEERDVSVPEMQHGAAATARKQGDRGREADLPNKSKELSPPPVLAGAPIAPHEDVVRHRLAAGESATVEFKATLRWDVREERDNPGLQKSTTKTIAAFLNTDGGEILVGVNDDGTVRGLKPDYQVLGKAGVEGRDRFLQALANAIDQHLGPGVSPLIRYDIVALGDDDICVIEVRPSRAPVYFIEGNGRDEFYVRIGSTSRSLNHEEALRYARSHWSGV